MTIQQSAIFSDINEKSSFLRGTDAMLKGHPKCSENSCNTVSLAKFQDISLIGSGVKLRGDDA